jgi:AhpD family alkylhydroperoxidase
MRVIFWRQRRRYGQELEPARLWGRIPGAFVAMMALYRVLDRKRSPLEPSLRSIVQVRVSQNNACEFCDSLNSSLGLERGVEPEKLRQLASFEDSALYSEREKSALRYAEAVTRCDRPVDAALISMLRRQFDDQAIVELAALIAYQNMSSKFNAALGVPAQDFCAISSHAATKRTS